MGLFDDKKEHPSYGVVSWSRCSGGNLALFGSDVRHNNFISLKISTAESARGLSNDWVHETGVIAEVYMSPVQFAEFISSPNTTPVCCTLRFTKEAGIIEPAEFEPKVETFKKEFKKDIEDIVTNLSTLVAKAREVAEAPRAKKSELRELQNMVNSVEAALISDMPFVYEQFAKQMSKTVLSAKAEVEAYVEHRIRETGLQALTDMADNMPKLLESEKE